MAVTVIVLLWMWESLQPFFAGVTSRKKHALVNLILALLNVMIISIFIATVITWISTYSATHRVGLLYLANLPWWAHGILAFLVVDIWTYFWHRLNHRLPFLWRFHRVHHSDPAMDVTTGTRFHAGEILFSSVIRVILIPLIGIPIEFLLLYDTVQLPIVYFHHANIAVPERIDRVLRSVIVTPFMHKVHHSRWQPETDSNYSSVLTWWDRIFRSYRERKDWNGLSFGLDGFDGERNQSVAGLLSMPLQEQVSREDQ